MRMRVIRLLSTFPQELISSRKENHQETMRSQERDHENHRIEQRFMDRNRQIGELNSVVRAFTEKISNGR